MTLDEAIKHCLEVAEQNETQTEKIGRQFIGSAKDKCATDCRECAADHRQLAEWLTELKERREADVQPVKRGTWLQHGRPDDYFWCCSACQKWIIFAEHDLHKHHFCGNCGARMDGDVE